VTTLIINYISYQNMYSIYNMINYSNIYKTQENTHTHTHTHAHWVSMFYGDIDVMDFILYKLYIISLYTNPTTKPSHNRNVLLFWILD